MCNSHHGVKSTSQKYYQKQPLRIGGPGKMGYSELLRSPHWQRKRLEIMQRDNFKCQYCGDTETTLNVHHLMYLPSREPWAYDDDCLITICEPCHAQEEKYKVNDQFLINAFSLSGLSRDRLTALAIQLKRYLRNKPDAHERFMNLIQNFLAS